MASYLPSWSASWLDSLRMPTVSEARERPVTTALVAAAGVLGVALVWRSWSNRNKRGPPIVPGWPIVGNLLDISENKMHLDFVRLQERYNLPDVFTVRMGPSKLVVLNSFDAMKDCFLTQGDLFSTRPPIKALKLIGYSDELMLKEFLDPTWKEGKAFILSCLRSAGFGSPKGSEAKILDQVTRLEQKLEKSIRDGEAVDFPELLPFVTANVIMEIMFNTDFSYDDPELIRRIEIVREWTNVLNSIFILDYIPWWAVKCFFGGRIRKIRDMTEEAVAFCRDEVKAHVATLDPENTRDFTDEYLSKKKGPIDERLLANTILNMMPDSIDSAAAMLSWIIVYLTTHAEVQEKVWQEIETVTSGNRSVTWADRPELPYCESVIMEILRVSPPFSLTMLHTPVKDTFFRGFFLPKGVAIIGNLHTALNDPMKFPEPENFKADRFVDTNGKLRVNEAWMLYGLGRRRCIGEPLAKMEAFLFTTNLFQKYKFIFAGDSPSLILDGPKQQLGSAPQPYKVKLTPRK